MANRIFYQEDCNLGLLDGKTIAIIGYGSQGHAHALNLKDSGCEVCVGLREGSKNWAQAEAAGLTVKTVAEAAKWGDIVMMLINDEVQADVYKKDIAPYLEEGNALAFAHGFNIHFKTIVPPANVDVIMVAPRMIGKGVRETYENGTGFPTFLVVNQDATGHAKEIAVGLAKALGSTKAGAIEVTFNDETYLDLMSEQAIWPLIMNVMVTAFDFFAEKGLPAEAILTEMYMSKEPMVMMEKMADMGLFKQLPLHSRTSQYGQMSRFKMVDNTSMRQFIEEQYNKIVDGSFAQEWEEVKADDMKKFDELRAETEKLPISVVEAEVRKNLSGGKAN